MTREVVILVSTDHDLDDSNVQEQFERLIKGYNSTIKHEELFDVEVIEVLKIHYTK